MLKALREVIVTNHFDAKQVNLSLSGQNALIPFIKIPSMSTDPEKIRELVTYEAKSRIPYPLEEVVWDYQLIENPDGGDEIDAMLVSIKNEDVLKITDVLESAGKKVRIIEVSPTALYNSARANGIGSTQCEMILNIGGKSSTLVFLDGPRFFIRSIPVAGNTITQQIAKEFNMSFTEADEIKRRHGFVALGGAYEDPESDMAATVSKIVRNVMTRLHGEINRSINVYRATQHGRKPEKLYLAGGSSVMAFTPRFFIEKLRIPVDYFNPFQVITVCEDIDRESIAGLSHLYGETIGLALRHFRSTPIEISLIPERVRKQNAMRMKRPYFFASAIALLVYLGITFWALNSQEDVIKSKDTLLGRAVEIKQNTKQRVDREKSMLAASTQKYKEAMSIIEKRDSFFTILNEVQNVIPPDMWLTDIRFSAEPIHTNVQSGSANASSRRTTRGGRRARNVSAGGDSAAKASEMKWVNVTGYLVCSESELPMYRLGNLTNEFQKLSVIKKVESQNEITQHCVLIERIGGSNLSKFKFSMQLNNQQGR